MSQPFSDDDVGKRIENAEGEPIGSVTAVEEDVAYAETDPGVTDSITATLGWESDQDETVPVRADDVREITDEAIRLEATGALHDDSDDGGRDSVLERDDGAGEHDVDHTDDESTTVDYGDADDRPGDERHPDSAEAPPEGDRTVTKERGHEEDR